MPNCIVCGADMPTAAGRQKCCSDACRKSWKTTRRKAWPRKSTARHRDPVPCQICGEMFTPISIQNTICRNGDCRKKAKQALKSLDFVEKECPICGKVFRTPNRRQKTCGYSCGRALRTVEAKAAQDRPVIQTKLVQCAQCGRMFPREIGSTAKTCSFECAGQLAAATVMTMENARNPMRCPWDANMFDTLPAPGVSWHSAEADPMSGGFPMITFNAPSVAHEVAA